MSATTLKQELNQRIDLLPDSSVRLLIDFLDSIHASEQEAASSASTASRTYRTAGALKGHLKFMADDFDETPECFEEYM